MNRPRMIIRPAMALALVLVATAVRAQSLSAARTELPIAEVRLSDGTRRYAVPIVVGATTLRAGLDTGSTGLRILPRVLDSGDARSTRRDDSYSFDSGAKLDGVIAGADLMLGDLRGRTTVQLVNEVGCTEDHPGCAFGKIPLSVYGVEGNGLPGEGFKAIIGVKMGSAEIANPFAALGARRWIIELPRPGEAGPGRIVLNPTDAEAAGYVTLPTLSRLAKLTGALHDGVTGCLINRSTSARFCGAVVLDTGSVGIIVTGRAVGGAPWPQGAPATLAMGDGTGHAKVAELLTIGMRPHASRLTFERRADQAMTIIVAGISPYFAFSVRYDPEHGTIGLEPRPPAAGGPVGKALN